jgi:adenylylsulfate kinase
VVIWIIGLSGSGKSTLANHLVNNMREKGLQIVLLDGDVIRTLFGNDVDHSIEGRRLNAERLSKLSNFLSAQGIHVVAAVLSIFPEWRSWNRKNISQYYEVYMKASIETLLKRDIKNLYKPALAGKIKNVVGIDIPFPEPDEPDLTIDNNINLTTFDELVNRVLSIDLVKQELNKK